ncbi:leucine-rich repeat and immunoglobulin-like domain-containing nogo receptor-interacting protein 2 [Esox lucius]|uniref:Ig-like domain-containing protein n=1 Tax=Esox lucius TaxID=8010 RepID=A0A3P9AIP5_ESOLU|nr:leucine-rich repeat and immunoglobulin-like domain-containing nogo receptor-interacting protein 2 [Esox lucius]XP_019901262.2 leucine-rich repeat and immunoglobulin-like domain-containing nogo receptor-interacting protein 2 [Esox lucius]XP_019901263.2 leucine-rich repeat and immunoglobulin-like domain-containing nogo receptor-interacting protein 2 [Esox lucius]XP_034147532.1 leucine-rich repeat and immunoglobulin-like domain-containing nogo receptor-interacting protein 2 [Esox lucius]
MVDCMSKVMLHTALSCWQPLLGLALLAVFVGSALGCPARCDCSAQSKSVLCHRKRLPGIPDGIPIETRILDLSKNKLQAINPDDFAPYPGLEDLDLSGNIISYVEPGAFNPLYSMHSLSLKSNRIKLIPQGVFTGLSNLTRLDVSDNKIVILLDYMFQDLHNLRSLEVGDNDLVYISHRAFSGLLSLETLALERCNLTVVPTEALSHLHNLVSLHLRHLSIGTLHAYSFKKLSRLRHLEIDSWPSLDSVSANTLHGLNLSTLFITNTNLSSFPYQALRHLHFLTHLNLSFNRIRHIEGGMLSELVHLKELHLVGAQLSTIEPYAFQGLRWLKVLNVSHNRLDTLEKGVFQAPEVLEVLLIDDNPLVCDCRLMWILQKRHSIFFGDSQPECSTPEGIRGRPFREFKETLLSYYVTCTKPKIRENKTQMIAVDEGQPVRLHCSAEGTPRPVVSWLSPRRRLLTNKSHGRVTVHNNGTLEIKAAEVQDGGVYLCMATNTAGNDSLMASLAVKSLGSLYANRTQYYTDPSNVTTNGTSNVPYGLDLKTILVSTAMGCFTFLGVVLFCFLLLFVWSRGKGKHKNNIDIEYVPRSKSNGTSIDGGAEGQAGPRRFNMKMI